MGGSGIPLSSVGCAKPLSDKHLSPKNYLEAPMEEPSSEEVSSHRKMSKQISAALQQPKVEEQCCYA